MSTDRTSLRCVRKRVRRIHGRSNMPARRSCTSPGEAATSAPGAASTGLETPSGELWFRACRQGCSQLRVCCSNCCSPASRCRSRFTRTMTFARSIGLRNGKSEAWYILSATPGAQIARRAEAPDHAAGIARVDQGRVDRRPASLAPRRNRRRRSSSPPGTIHAIGAGIVLAEIQQRSDATFRLFDYGSQRELHEDDAVAAADCGAASRTQPIRRRLTTGRTRSRREPTFRS